jgi:carbon monoxide dehydrogenase subunit G
MESLTEKLPMAMTMMGDIQLHANREAVWAKLNDPAVLKSCIPGCEQLDMLSDSEFQAVATVKVGPVKTRWKGKVRLSDFDPPNGYRISGEGDGGVAGFAKGAAKVSLADKDGGTLLSYNVESQIGGKLAQLGQRLINSAAKKTADDFFEKFRTAVATDPAGHTATSTSQWLKHHGGVSLQERPMRNYRFGRKINFPQRSPSNISSEC